MKDSKITCREVMHHICENLDEDLDSPKCSEIKHHLEDCDNCRNYFNSVETTIKFYKKYDVKISREAHIRLINFLGLEETGDSGEIS